MYVGVHVYAAVCLDNNQTFKLLHARLGNGKALSGTEMASLAPAPMLALKHLGLVRHGLRGLQLGFA